MRMKVTGRHIEVTEALRAALDKKIGKLDKYFQYGGPIEANVTLGVQRELHSVEITLFLGGLILRSEDKTTDMYASIDAAVDKLERQIHKYKTRINRKMREQGSEPLFFGEEEAINDEESRIVRTKRFAVKPMSPEEAVLQMELLGHNFFVFRDGISEDVAVVYKRKDGNYGLIEPY